MADFNTVTEFEGKISEFFGAPYAVAVDSCTHGLELCLRLTNRNIISCPKNTYLSVPMLANKLRVELIWRDHKWIDFYAIAGNIVDGAVYWKRGGYYAAGRFICLSFQYQKHLSLGRGGMILCPDEQSYWQLKKMSYDGRLPGIPWREQDIDTMGLSLLHDTRNGAIGIR